MKKPQRRDNSYWLGRLRGEHPKIYRDYRAGIIKSVAEARRLAGLFSTRTPLHELKNAWNKASIAQRRIFITWARSRSPSRTSPSAGIIAVQGRLEASAAKRIAEIMRVRGLKSGDLMAELGFSRLDASVMSAVTSGTKIRPAVASALGVWLTKNAGVR